MLKEIIQTIGWIAIVGWILFGALFGGMGYLE
jgi:hypothetical protein